MNTNYSNLTENLKNVDLMTQKLSQDFEKTTNDLSAYKNTTSLLVEQIQQHVVKNAEDLKQFSIRVLFRYLSNSH
jgi:hypothetical protein